MIVVKFLKIGDALKEHEKTKSAEGKGREMFREGGGEVEGNMGV
jgi:hypothetical protein